MAIRSLFVNRFRLVLLAFIASIGLAVALLFLGVPGHGSMARASSTVNFSIGSRAADGAVATCDSSGLPTSTCDVPQGVPFKVSFFLNTLPSGMVGGGYTGYNATLGFAGGVSNSGGQAGVDQTIWPGCVFHTAYLDPGSVLLICAPGIGAPPSTYIGRMATVQFTCTTDGSVTLVSGLNPNPVLPGNTFIQDSAYNNYAEAADESLAIHCLPPTTPTLTFTPTSTATRTPTPTATSTPCPDCVLDFSIGTDLLSGAGVTCDSSGSPTAACDVPLGGKFNANVYLNSLPGGGGYDTYTARLAYSGVTATAMSSSLHMGYWPDCVLDSSQFSSGEVFVACIDFGKPPSSYTGRMAAPEFTCTSDGSITLLHGDTNTSIYGVTGGQFSEAADESLTIHCVPPAAYPADTDGDGCPDAREAGMNQTMGGRRNFLNPWDWWDPTGDQLDSIGDVLAVASHYGGNAGQPGYDAKYDRTYIGPNPWNLGPPDGMIRSVDINLIVRQYGAGCSAS